MTVGFSSAWARGHRILAWASHCILKHGTLSKALRAEDSAALHRACFTAAATTGKQRDAAIARRGGETGMRGIYSAVTLYSLTFHRNPASSRAVSDTLWSRL
jgi:hypothetical protein